MVAIFTGLGSGFERGSPAQIGGGGFLGASGLGRGGESAFLNAATGNFLLSRQDEFLVGRGPDISIARTYNSLGVLGHDDNDDLWRQSSDRRILGAGPYNVIDHTVTRLSADGSLITYTYKNWGDGTYYRTTDGDGAYDKLVYDSGANTWTWTDGGSQLREIYGASGVANSWRILQQKDVDENTVSFTYDGAGKLTQIATANQATGAQSRIEYVWSGAHIISVVTKYTDFSQPSPVEKTLTRTTYGYDGQDRLTSVTVDETPDITTDNATTPETLYTTTYTYDGSSKRIASISQTDGSSLAISYVYDSVSQTYRVSQLAQIVSGSDTRTTTITYTDEAGNGLRRTEITDPRGQVTKIWSKIATGELTKVSAPPVSTGATAQTTQFAYDAKGNLTSVTDAQGAVTSFLYDTNGNTIRITDALGNKTYRAYNIGADYGAYVDNYADLLNVYTTTIAPTGRSKADWGEEHWVFYGSGEGRTLPLAGVAGTNAMTREARIGAVGGVQTLQNARFIYDSENHLRFAISAEGRVTEYRYSAPGLLEFTIGYPQHGYSGVGWTVPTEAQMVAWRDGLADRSSTQITQYIRDDRGNLLETYANGIATTAGVGSAAEGYSHRIFSYDQTGVLRKSTTEGQVSETFVYDGLGRLISSTDLNGGTTTIAFTDASTLTTVTTGVGFTTVSTYNKAGEVIATATSGADTVGGNATFTYDKQGHVRIISRDSAAGSLLRQDKSYVLYDLSGRKIADIGHDGQMIEYRYDQLNRLVATVRYNTLLTTAQISDLNNLSLELQLGVNFARPTTHANDLWQWSVYDAGGRVIETILGDGSATTFVYDTANRLIGQTSYYNKLSQTQINALIAAPPTTIVAPTADAARDRVTRTFYDRDGRVTGALDGEGYLSQIFYDAAGQKVRELGYFNQTAAGLRATGSFADLLGSFAQDANNDVWRRFVYDGQGLLRYEIDALGRVSERIYWSGTASLASGLVRKTVRYATALGSVPNYSYAAVKAAILTNAADRIAFNVYNDRGQLAYAVDALGAVTGFKYDAAGRVTKLTQYAAFVDMSAQGSEAQWKANLDTWTNNNGANARITRNYYAARGDLLYTIDPEGYVVQHNYEAQGRLFSSYLYSGKITTSDASTIASIAADPAKGTAALTSYRYDPMGRLNDVWDANGTRNFIAYNGNGTKLYDAVAFMQGPESVFTMYEYDNAGRLTKRTDGAGTAEAAITQFGYDGQGNMTTLTDPLNRITAFAYDRVGRVKTHTDANLGVTSFDYDAFGRGVKATDVLGASTYSYFDRLGRITLMIDAAQYATETVYNPFGEAASITKRANVTSGAAIAAPPTITTNAAADQTTTFTYDKTGALIGQVNALSGQITHQRDAFGAIVKTIDARGNASYFYHDKLNHVTLAIDTEGYATQTTFDYEGRVKTVLRRALRATNIGNVDVIPTITGDAGDSTTSFVYDARGQLLNTTDAMGAVTAHEYDRRGNRIKTTNALLGVTERKFDALNRLIEETVWFGDNLIATSPKSITKLAYDGASNLTQTIEAFGEVEQRTTTYGYDNLNLLRTITRDAIAAINSATGAVVTPVEQLNYDAKGNLIEKIDAMGARTLYWYDPLGRVTYELTAAETISGGGQKGEYARNFYDANGNLTERRVFGALVTLPPTGSPPPAEPSTYRQTLYQYDKLNRLSSIATPNVDVAYLTSSGGMNIALAAAPTTWYEYDANGNIKTIGHPNGAETYFYYDKLGRKTAQVDGGRIMPVDYTPPLPDAYRTDWSYDAAGNVVQEIRYATKLPGVYSYTSLPAVGADANNDRVTNFTYDRMGRRLTETRLNVLVHNGSGGHSSTSSTVAYTYNALGQVETKLEATQDKIAYTFDRGGRILSEKRTLNNQTYLYTDAFGASVAPTVEYSYNALSDVTQTKAVGNANALQRLTNFTYGAGGRLLAKSDATGFTHAYIYDRNERIVRDQYTRVLPSGSAEEAIGYDYDLKGRVIAQGVMAKVSGVYTRSLTNTLGESIDTFNTHYSAYGEVSERGLNGVYAEKFEYDAAGRLLKSNSGDGVWKFFMYDAAGNRSVTIQSVGTNLTAAATDTLGEVLALWGANPNAIAAAMVGVNVAGLAVTLTRYNERNLAVDVREPQRQLSAGGALQNLLTTRVYTAFGEVAYEIDALGARIDYTYNTMGRRIKTESPSVEGRGANGRWIVGYNASTGAVEATSTTATTYRPVEHFYYDASGRVVAQRDGNANLTRYTLLAGSGYEGSEALIVSTLAPDLGESLVGYDIHGDARKLTDQIARVTWQTFDRMGRVLTIARPWGLDETFEYDGLGQRIRHWNDLLGSGAAETTLYDQQGRVLTQTAMGGDATSYLYGWSGALATAGMATFGGWVKRTTYANTKTTTDSTDFFGHLVSHTNMSALVSNSTYNLAGQLVSRTGGDTTNFTYFNTNRLATQSATTAGVTRTAAFGYDKLGRLLTETLTSGSQQWKNATSTYDALGRLISWSEAGSTYTPAASLAYTYDANGNIRRSLASFRALDSYGTFAPTPTQQDYWYLYDTMNRVVRQKGMLQGTSIVRGSGVDLEYDKAGQRTASLRYFEDSYMHNDPEVPNDHYQVPFTNERIEFYVYDQGGRLTQVSVADGYYLMDHPYYSYVAPSSEGGVVRGVFTYDDMGRMLTQADYGGVSGGQVHYSRTLTYNAKSQITLDLGSTRQGADLFTSETTFTYGSGATYALGAALTVETKNWKNGNAEKTTVTTNTYAWADGAVQSQVAYDSDKASSTNQINTSTFTYATVGGQTQVTQAAIIDGRSLRGIRMARNMAAGPRNVTYSNDLNGQAIRRDESDSYSSGDPHEFWYRFGGRQMGFVGNNGTSDVEYRTSTAERAAGTGTGPYRNGSNTSVLHADFDQSLAPINSYYQGAATGGYTVRQGETLASIAANLWGDASLWYKLAEANGLTQNALLVEGQSLVVPAGAMKNTHNARTFSPYDPVETLGDTAPVRAKPPKKPNNCGGLGQIILVIIAVVVSIYTGGAATGFFSTTMGMSSTAAGIAGAAVGGAVGSIASQAVGVATGIQDKFSWNAVALSALSAGVGAGVGAAAEAFGSALFSNDIVQGVTSNIITQGIAVATGLQDKFSWAGVAAAGVSAGVGDALGREMKLESLRINQSAQNITGHALVGGARAIAGAATRSLIDGTDFGDNVMAALPDAIGQTIGQAMAGKIAGAMEEARTVRAIAKSMNISHEEAARLLAQDRVMYDRAAQVAAENAPELQLTRDHRPDPAAFLRRFTDGTDGDIDAIRANIDAYLDSVGAQAAERYPLDGVIMSALAQNAALVQVYSSLALEMPDFQWTYVGGFMAHQVRDEILNIYHSSNLVAAVSAFMPPGSPVPAGANGMRDHLITKLIEGQRGVVSDIGSMALSYGMRGAEAVRLDLLAMDRRDAALAFSLQFQADTYRRMGTPAAQQRAADLGTQAAYQLGIVEQTRLQGMWDDIALNAFAQVNAYAIEHGWRGVARPIDIYVGVNRHNPNDPYRVGSIRAPASAYANANVADLRVRLSIAGNAFNVMHDTVFAPRAMGNSQTFQAVRTAFTQMLNPSNLYPAPRPLVRWPPI